MKPAALRPRARDDRRAEVRYHREKAGSTLATKLVAALAKALQELERHPAIGSPTLGQTLDIDGLSTWRIDGFPLTWWYFERADHLDVIRLVGQRQDPGEIQP